MSFRCEPYGIVLALGWIGCATSPDYSEYSKRELMWHVANIERNSTARCRDWTGWESNWKEAYLESIPGDELQRMFVANGGCELGRHEIDCMLVAPLACDFRWYSCLEFDTSSPYGYE